MRRLTTSIINYNILYHRQFATPTRVQPLPHGLNRGGGRPRRRNCARIQVKTRQQLASTLAPGWKIPCASDHRCWILGCVVRLFPGFLAEKAGGSRPRTRVWPHRIEPCSPDERLRGTFTEAHGALHQVSLSKAESLYHGTRNYPEALCGTLSGIRGKPGVQAVRRSLAVEHHRFGMVSGCATGPSRNPGTTGRAVCWTARWNYCNWSLPG